MPIQNIILFAFLGYIVYLLHYGATHNKEEEK